MVKRGFDETATKADLADVKTDLMSVKTDLVGVEKRLTQRIEILEHRVLNKHSTRIDILEDNMRQVKTKLGIA